MVTEPKIEAPVPVGSRVELYTDIEADGDGGSAASILYEGTVKRFNPSTGDIAFDDGTRRAEFLELLDESDGYQVYTDFERW